MTLVPGPWSAVATSPEESLARVLGDPDGVRSVQRPVVDLADRACCGWVAGVRLAGAVGQDAGPWFRAADRTGHGDRLAQVALAACLRSRGTLPGGRSLVVPVSTRHLGSGPVLDLLDAEDDVAGLILLLDADPEGPRSRRELPGRAADRIAGLRARGMRIAADAGQAGVLDLDAMHAWAPDVHWMSSTLVRSVDQDVVRQRLVALLVELAAGADGAVVVADGVESPGEVRALHELGVDWALGWLFGRSRTGFTPPVVDVAALLPRPRPVDLTEAEPDPLPEWPRTPPPRRH